MNINNLLHTDYWFGQPFAAQGVTLWLLISGFLLLIVAGLVSKITAQFQEAAFKRAILKRCGTLAITMGFLGLVWMFFRQEGIRFLAWRFWLLVWLGIFVWWLSGIVRYIMTRRPDITPEADRQARIAKYLPKNR